MKRSICLSFHIVAILAGFNLISNVVAVDTSKDDHATLEEEFWNFASCDMKCANDGYCSLIEGTVDELTHLAQSGKLITSCVCKPGYTGVACENIHQDCILSEKKCSNGFPCREVNTDQNGTVDWKCDCALADSMSEFAGKMCRDPLTEYCSGKFDPHAPLSFCTNGGRCRGDFIGAQVDAGNTTVNAIYQHAGCLCPRDFYGPHCEFLKLNVIDDLGNNFDFNKDSGNPSSTQPTTEKRSHLAPILTGVFILLSVSLVITAVVLHYRQVILPPVRRIQFRGYGDNVTVMTMSTEYHGQYLGNIQFLDEGIISQHELDTIFENVELS